MLRRSVDRTLQPETDNTGVGSVIEILIKEQKPRAEISACGFNCFIGGTKMKKTKKLIECALLIAVATVLSFVKLLDLPYGGSITAASLLPMIIISYRHGFLWGFGSGIVYGVIQQLSGLNTLSYATSWKAAASIIFLDYLAAFAACCFGGTFKGKLKNSGAEIALGSVAVCFLRYICHVISGATVWAGISIPTAAALGYSIVYNATYMIPETIVLVVVGYYLASTMDFEKDIPTRKKSEKGGIYALLSGLLLSVAVIFDTVSLFGVLQDGKTGEFTFANIGSAPWLLMTVVTVLCLVLAVFFRILTTKKQK